MTPDEAADLAGRTNEAIDHDNPSCAPCCTCATEDADRERVASDLAILVWPALRTSGTIFPAVLDYAATNLRRTAALYGVTP